MEGREAGGGFASTSLSTYDTLAADGYNLERIVLDSRFAYFTGAAQTSGNGGGAFFIRDNKCAAGGGSFSSTSTSEPYGGYGGSEAIAVDAQHLFVAAGGIARIPK
ncbi:MAG: hypothetical protein ACRENE_01015 [Polyangiaceae bacterium]